MENPESIENLNCAGCMNDIGDDDYISALHQDWHKDCFRCSVCDCQLSTWYLEKAGMLFCQRDYWERYGDSCHQCTQVITGPVMAAGEHRFHPECFACARCGAPIEDAQPYALLQRQQLYCGLCACAALAAGPAARRHVLRCLRAPASALRLAARHLTLAQCAAPLRRKLTALARALLLAVRALCPLLACPRVDDACGLLALHAGDRVLEINGTPVCDRPREEIEKVLACPDAVLQLTIEHNPDCPPSPSPISAEVTPSIPEPQPSAPELQPSAPESDPSARETDDTSEGGGKRERLFKRKGEAGRGRGVKRRQGASPLLKDKEKSSSMSKLLDVVEGSGGGDYCGDGGVLLDLSRARSFRASPQPAPAQRVFRAADLIQGELLGSGFFGEVYKVTHRATGELMVLKQLYRVDEQAQRNFLKEVAVLRSLQHPNVLRFIGVLYRDKRLHLVTEYVCGGTLHDLLQDTSLPLSWEFRARLARDVACGVGYLHRMNVIHRDLNSHNCLVREDKTVIVADFGLARIVERTASSTLQRRGRATDATLATGATAATGSLRRKRYTVVGNPYWMAPEMINGNVYDEKVDVFSFGIMLCEIIGRVSADPDFLPRRNDFGLNEAEFVDKFCAVTGSTPACPEPLYRVAFLACDLDPDRRPPFEVLEIWLESLVMHLSKSSTVPPSLLADMLQYGASNHAPSPDCCRAAAEDCREGHEDCRREDGGCCRTRRSPSKVASVDLTNAEGVLKSKSNAAMLEWCLSSPPGGRLLGKCVSASHISARAAGTAHPAAGPGSGAGAGRSRSHALLPAAPAGYILRADGRSLNITKVDDITEWLDPPPLKRSSQLGNIAQESKARRLQDDLPAFLRNQSVEGLQTQRDDTAVVLCHHSVPDSDSSDDDVTQISDWYRNVSSHQKTDVEPSKNILAGIAKKGENLLGKKSYDVAEAQANERKQADERRKYTIEYLKSTENGKTKTADSQSKPAEKTNFFTKKLLSPKLSRLFKPNTAEVLRTKQNNEENKEEKSKSKFFVQRPSSPVCRSSYRVRPVEEPHEQSSRKTPKDNVIKSDLKLASMGKPMTPIFRRHVPAAAQFADGRFSYRDKRHKSDGKPADSKYLDYSRKVKTPIVSTEEARPKLGLVRSSPNNNLTSLATVLEKDREKPLPPEGGAKKREGGISRSNYVSLANLRINGKPKLDKVKPRDGLGDLSPVERVI